MIQNKLWLSYTWSKKENDENCFKLSAGGAAKQSKTFAKAASQEHFLLSSCLSSGSLNLLPREGVIHWMLRQSAEWQRTTWERRRGLQVQWGRALAKTRLTLNGAFLTHEKDSIWILIIVFFLQVKICAVFCFFFLNDFYIRMRPHCQGRTPFSEAYMSVIRARSASHLPASSLSR